MTESEFVNNAEVLDEAIGIAGLAKTLSTLMNESITGNNKGIEHAADLKLSYLCLARLATSIAERLSLFSE